MDKRELGLAVMLVSVLVAIILTIADCNGLIANRQLAAYFVSGIATPSVSVGVLAIIFHVLGGEFSEEVF